MRAALRMLIGVCWIGAGLALAAERTAFEDFHHAIGIGDKATVTAYLRRGMDPNLVDEAGNPALVNAVRGGDLDLVAALLKAGAKVNRRTPHGDSAIMIAALQGRLDMVKLLRKFGAEINHSGWSPLLYAATGGHTAVMVFLLESGADVSTVAPNGVTPLMMAVRGGFADAVRVLLDHGADPKFRAESGATALSWAEERSQKEIAALLRAAGAAQ